MENTNAFGSFEQNGGFGDFGGFGGQAEPITGEAVEASVQVSDAKTLNGIPLMQINGLQNGRFADLNAAKDAIMAQDAAELQRRKENGLAFQWVKTVVDKVDWVINPKGKRVLKSAKFLGWQVITNDTNGTPILVTDQQLLSYISAHCPRSGKIGQGSTGLQLKHALRTNKSSKGGNFTHSHVFSLVPLEKNVTKYQEDKLDNAKVPVNEEDGVTPVTVLKPGAPKDSTDPADRIPKYDWKSQEYRDVFGVRRSAKAKKKDAQSQEAFDLLVYINGLKDDSAYI